VTVLSPHCLSPTSPFSPIRQGRIGPISYLNLHPKNQKESSLPSFFFVDAVFQRELDFRSSGEKYEYLGEWTLPLLEIRKGEVVFKDLGFQPTSR